MAGSLFWLSDVAWAAIEPQQRAAALEFSKHALVIDVEAKRP
jgi:hypothetical protein